MVSGYSVRSLTHVSEEVLEWHDDWIRKNEQLLDEAIAAAPNVRQPISNRLATAYVLLAVP